MRCNFMLREDLAARSFCYAKFLNPPLAPPSGMGIFFYFQKVYTPAAGEKNILVVHARRRGRLKIFAEQMPSTEKSQAQRNWSRPYQ
jgi:hypothetical protein